MAQVKTARTKIKLMDIEILALKFYDYSLYMRGYSPSTLRKYKHIINFFKSYTGLQNIKDINEKNLRSFFLFGRIERNWKPGTFINFHRTISVFFQWCVANNYMDRNFITDIELPKVEKRLPTKLIKQDAQKLLEVAFNYPYDYPYLRYRNHAIFSLFMFAGLRKSELLKLKLSDVDIENLTIFVNQGKGNKDRVVPMSFTLAQTLKRYLEERKRLKKTCSEFFASLNRNLGFTNTGLRNLIAQMRAASGIKFSAHKLRHTFATLMLEGGCDIYSLSKMMGHSDIKTTTIYLSASADHLRSQMTKHPLNT
jgi:site-specific recombinase XerD